MPKLVLAAVIAALVEVAAANSVAAACSRANAVRNGRPWPADTVRRGLTHSLCRCRRENLSGAIIFTGTHAIGTRAGAVAVSRDIGTTGNARLRRRRDPEASRIQTPLLRRSCHGRCADHDRARPSWSQLDRGDRWLTTNIDLGLAIAARRARPLLTRIRENLHVRRVRQLPQK
jgi:hypothetical protein